MTSSTVPNDAENAHAVCWKLSDMTSCGGCASAPDTRRHEHACPAHLVRPRRPSPEAGVLPSPCWSDPEPGVYAHGYAAADCWRFDGDVVQPQPDELIEEVPVALAYGGEAPIVMMATPLDAEDFALGFAISEGIVDRADQIIHIEAVPANGGLLVRVDLADGLQARVAARRRLGVGSGACGLCGVDQIEEALRTPPLVPAGERFAASAIREAFAQLPDLQRIGAHTGAAHGAAFADRRGRILAFAEDAGRHNALDKLIGKVARLGIDPSAGFCAVTSRASFEMAQKAAVARFAMLCAISAPTGLAVRLARACNLTLCAFVRGQRFACYATPERLSS